MEKQIFTIADLKILEPGTFISDIILAIACFYFFASLRKIGKTRHHKHLVQFFLFMALSSFVGAFAHCFFLYTGKTLHFFTWVLTAIAVYLMEYGISSTIKEGQKRNNFILFIRIQLILCILLASVFMSFMVVKINTTIGLLGIVFPILLMQVLKKQNKDFIYVMLGIALAILPAITHQIRFSFGGIFNMNDLSHFFLVLCLFFIYKGIKQNIGNEKIKYIEAVATN